MSTCINCNRNTETWSGLCARCDTSIDTTDPDDVQREPDPADQADQFWSFGYDSDSKPTPNHTPAASFSNALDHRHITESERHLLHAIRRLSSPQRTILHSLLRKLAPLNTHHCAH